jgi:hypothetical protein
MRNRQRNRRKGETSKETHGKEKQVRKKENRNT